MIWLLHFWKKSNFIIKAFDWWRLKIFLWKLSDVQQRSQVSVIMQAAYYTRLFKRFVFNSMFNWNLNQKKGMKCYSYFEKTYKTLSSEKTSS